MEETQSLKIFNYSWRIFLEASYNDISFYVCTFMHSQTHTWLMWLWVNEEYGPNKIKIAERNFRGQPQVIGDLKACYAE